jgi:nitroreductase
MVSIGVIASRFVNVTETLYARRSVRGFLPKRVVPETLKEIFEAAQRAPSWCNIQPWRVTVTSGDVTQQLVTALVEAAETEAPAPDVPWPGEFHEPYSTRRKQCGVALYTAMGVTRSDTEGRKNAWIRNYRGFDAPHIAIVSYDARLGVYGALDIGCWLQSLMLVALQHGVASCAQACLSTHPATVRKVLQLDPDEAILFGIALGYEDPAVAANHCRTDRAPLEDAVRFVG